MITVRMASPEEIQEMLFRFGAEKTDMFLEDPHDSPDCHRLWKTSWGTYFYVPALGPDEVCLYEVLLRICADLEKQRPDDG